MVCIGCYQDAFSALPVNSAIAEPIVILEYRGSRISTKVKAACIHSGWTLITLTHHKVMQDETLSHIIANYYGGSGLDKAFVQMAIVKKTDQLLSVANPNYLYAGKSLHLPSLNEIRAMLIRKTSLLNMLNQQEIIVKKYFSLAAKRLLTTIGFMLFNLNGLQADGYISGAELRDELNNYLAEQDCWEGLLLTKPSIQGLQHRSPGCLLFLAVFKQLKSAVLMMMAGKLQSEQDLPPRCKIMREDKSHANS